MQFTQDQKKADKVKRFISTYCILSKGQWSGQPLQLLPWQTAIVDQLYGQVRPDGTRRYRRAGLWIPKKNGKSSLLSALCLYHLLEEQGSEVYCVAADVHQAKIVFLEAANMVEQSPALKARLWVRRNINTIEDKKGRSVFRVLSSEPSGKAGFNASFIAYDELAEWGAHARDVWDQLQNATIARKQGLQVVISTAQYDKAHIGYEQYSYAKKVLADPELDPYFLPVVYEVPEHEDWTDPKNWEKANPSWGVTVSAESFHEDYTLVKNNPQEESRFRTLRLNQWVGSAEQWIASNVWQDCFDPFTEADLEGASVIVGVDYARRGDLCAYVLLTKRNDILYLLPRFFIPRDVAKRKEQEDNVPYLSWHKQGFIHFTDGDTVDPAFMRRKLSEDSKRFDVRQVAFDPYGLEESRQLLEADGFDMIEVPQSCKDMASATAQFDRLCLSKKLRHNNNPVLSWCLENCKPYTNRYDEVRVCKSSPRARIDGITAAIIGLTRLDQLDNTTPSVEDLVIFV